MKKGMVLFFLVLLMTTSVQALDWAYSFVVWKGNVYEVTKEEISENDIGRYLGKVRTKPNDRNASYYGNASNAFPIGTKYFKIKGDSPENSIAVEIEKRQWLKAIYSHQAPFPLMNLFIKVVPVLILLVIVIAFILRWKNRRT